MTGRAPILGIAGLIFIVFALLEHWMTRLPTAGYFSFGWFALSHLGVGIICLIWYFSAGTGSVSSFVRARSTRYGVNSVIYSIVFIAIIGMANFFGVRYNHRFDLTAENVNSLAPQSREVLEALEEEVEILAFVGPSDKAFIAQIVDIYGYYGDKLKFRVIDPQINPELTQKEGITQAPTLKIKVGDRNTLVHQLNEEAITNGIHQVSSTDQKKVYFAEGHGEASFSDSQAPGGMGLLTEALRNQNYIVEGIFLGEVEAVPEDADALVLPSSDKSYFPAELLSVRKYIASGGNLMVLLEPQKNAELVELVEPFGIVVGDDIILDQKVRLFQGVSLGLDPVVSEYGSHESVEPMKERTLFSLARSVRPADGLPTGVEVDSIALTAKTSWAETDVDRVFESGEAILDEEDLAGPVSIAVATSGALAESEDEAGNNFRLVVFGDTSFATNQYLRQLFNDSLVLSVTAWLTGQEELISLGTRAIRASRAYLGEAQARSVFYLSVLVVPELILLLGISVWWRRSSL